MPCDQWLVVDQCRAFHGDVGLVAITLRWPGASLNQAFVDDLRAGGEGFKGLQALDTPQLRAKFRWRQVRTLCVEFVRQRRSANHPAWSKSHANECFVLRAQLCLQNCLSAITVQDDAFVILQLAEYCNAYPFLYGTTLINMRSHLSRRIACSCRLSSDRHTGLIAVLVPATAEGIASDFLHAACLQTSAPSKVVASRRCRSQECNQKGPEAGRAGLA